MRLTLLASDRLDEWLQAHVNTDKYCADLWATIQQIDKPEVKARLMLELIDFIKPRVKSIDVPDPGETRTIGVTFVKDNTPAKTENDE